MAKSEIAVEIEKYATLLVESDTAQERGDMGASCMRRDEADKLREQLERDGIWFVVVDDDIHVDGYKVFSMAEWAWVE